MCSLAALHKIVGH